MNQMKGVASEFSDADLAFEDAITSTKGILSKNIPWESLSSLGIIDGSGLGLLKRLPTDPHDQVAVIERDGAAYAALFIKLVSSVAQPEYIQYVLALIDNFLSEKESRLGLFLEMNRRDPNLPYEPLMNHLRRDGSDWFINSKVSKILGLFLVKSSSFGIDPEKVRTYKRSLLNWIVSHTRDIESQPKKVPPLLEALRTILRSQDARIIFDEFDGIDILGNFLKSPHHAVVYNSMFCLWLMSYNPHLAKAKFPHTTVVPRIVETLKQFAREKIIRVSIATLRNLAGASRESCIHIIEGGIMKLLPNLILRKWGDEELENNLKELDEILQQVLSELGSWDKYKAEILSGNLEWSMVHKNDRFWRENVSKFSENNFQIVGVLVDLIANSPNNIVVAVALNDIGRFVRFHPGGRGVLQSLPQAKISIMEKLNHPDPEVQKEALLAIQKLMVSNWEFLPQS